MTVSFFVRHRVGQLWSLVDQGVVVLAHHGAVDEKLSAGVSGDAVPPHTRRPGP